ncbi:MAG: hypothetical protein WC856_00115 [Methylococcaceae bacterium]
MLLADQFYSSIGLFQWLKVRARHVLLRLKGNRFSAGRFVTGTCRPSGTVDTDHGVSHALVRPDWAGDAMQRPKQLKKERADRSRTLKL